MAGESSHKPALLEVAAALGEVHRTLVQAVRAVYEREVGPAGGPGQMLRLLTEDPYFAWLHPMSELIVDLDSLLAQEILPPGTVAGVRQEIDRLTRAGGSSFWEKYAPFLQQDTDVVMAHGQLRRAINALPEAADGLHQRKEWTPPRAQPKRKPPSYLGDPIRRVTYGAPETQATASAMPSKRRR